MLYFTFDFFINIIIIQKTIKLRFYGFFFEKKKLIRFYILISLVTNRITTGAFEWNDWESPQVWKEIIIKKIMFVCSFHIFSGWLSSLEIIEGYLPTLFWRWNILELQILHLLPFTFSFVEPGSGCIRSRCFNVGRAFFVHSYSVCMVFLCRQVIRQWFNRRLLLSRALIECDDNMLLLFCFL